MIRLLGKKRFLALVMALALLLSLAPAAVADGDSGSINSGLTMFEPSHSWTAGNGAVTQNADGFTMTAAPIAGGCYGYSKSTTRVTLKSAVSSAVDATFHYKVEGEGTFRADGDELTGEGDYTVAVGAYESFELECVSTGIEGESLTVTLSGFSNKASDRPSVSFYCGYDGTVSPGSLPVRANGTLSWLPRATPSYMYPDRSFAGWFSSDGTYQYTTKSAFTADTTVYARFDDRPAKLIQGFYFNDKASVDGWTFSDSDGDGKKWQWYSANADPARAFGVPEGSGMIVSASRDTETDTPLDPDNWAYSPDVTLTASNLYVVLYAAELDEFDPMLFESFSIYVGTERNPTKMERISGSAELTTTGNGVFWRYTAEIPSTYAEKKVCIAIRHHNSAGNYVLGIDSVEICGDVQEYGLWVAGRQVTSENRGNILGDGSAAYDPDLNTLFLKKDIESSDELISNNSVSDLTIYVDKDVTLTRLEYPYRVIGIGRDTTITGPGTLTLKGSGGEAVTIFNYGSTTLTVRDAHLEIRDAVGIAGAAGAKLALENADVMIRSTEGAISGFDDITFTDCDLLEPVSGKIGAYGGAKAVLNADDTLANDVTIGTNYGILIDGRFVSDANRRDVFGDGVFSFDGEHTLTVKGDHTATVGSSVNNFNVPGLVIRVEGDVNLTGTAFSPAIILSEDTTITGPGTLTLKGDYDYAVRVDCGACLDLDELTVLCDGAVRGSGMGEELNLEQANLEAAAKKSGDPAVAGFTGGVATSWCEILEPENGKIESGEVMDKGYSPASSVRIGRAWYTWIDGVQITYKNKDDILGNGVFSFDGEYTLTVKGDYEATEHHVIDNKGGVTTIYVEADSALTAKNDYYPLYTSSGVTITGPGTLTLTGDRDAVHCVGSDVNFKDTTVILHGALHGTGMSYVYFENAKVEVTAREGHEDEGAIYGFDYYIGFSYCGVVEPEGGRKDGGAIVDAEGNKAAKAVIGKVWQVYIDGTCITEANKDDVLRNGVFSFDGDHTLTVKGDYAAVNENVIWNEGVDGLVIRVEEDSVLTGISEHSPVCLDRNATITGPGRLTVRAAKTRAIYVDYGSTLTIDSAHVTVDGTLFGASGGPRLVVRYSDLDVTSKSDTYHAVGGFYDITLEGCTIGEPAGGKISGGEITAADDGTAARVVITHEHVMAYKAESPADCHYPGVKEHFVCTICGKTFDDSLGTTEIDPTIPALGHDYGAWTIEEDPTCETIGKQVHTCSRCGDVEHEYIPALGHDYGDWTVTTPAGCETDGARKQTCSRCGYTNTEAIPAVGHDWDDWTVTTAPTCTAAGEETRVCKKDASHKETRPVEALGHDYADVVTPPACTEDGYTTHTCSRCGDTFTDTPVEKLGHDWGAWVVTTPATETTEGVETRICLRCSEKETRAIPVLGHTHSLVKVDAVPAACTADGTEAYYKCSGCGKLFSDAAGTTEIAAPKAVPSLGHNWGAWTVTTPATCTVAGEETRTCARCGETEKRAVEALGHSWGMWTVKTAATCTTAGEEERTCARCGETEKRTIEATGHLWGAWTVTTPATCGAAGEETRTCARCGEKETRPTAALSHSWGAWEVTVPPTETVPGQRTRTCTLCGAADTGEIPVLGHHHSLTPVDEVPATCTEDGHKAYYLCGDCGWMFEDAEGAKELSEADVRIPAKHDYIDEVVLPTCLEGGYTLHTCSRCGDSYVDEPVSATGHKLTHVEAKAATETVDGNIEHWRCDECGKLFADAAGTTELAPAAVVIPATGGGAKPGDVDSDGKVTPFDAVKVLCHLVGAPVLTGDEFARADANGDGQVTAADAAWILAHIG